MQNSECFRAEIIFKKMNIKPVNPLGVGEGLHYMGVLACCSFTPKEAHLDGIDS